MIIYPIIVLGLLLILFGVIWRRSFILNTEGHIPEEKIHLDPTHLIALLKKKKPEEPEIEIKTDTNINLKKAEELFRKRQYISAEKWYLEAIKVDPRNDKIYSRLGMIYIDQKNYSDARDALEEAIKIDPSVASRYFNLSFVYNSEGDKKMALMNAKKAVRYNSLNRKYRRWLEDLRSRPF
jgi:tetratricopeptide (TPR) repeat protein